MKLGTNNMPQVIHHFHMVLTGVQRCHPMASSSRAVRFVAASKPSSQGTLQLRLHVKPGASKSREGIIAVNDEAIELCVAAQARDGEANRAVVQVLCETLGIPKSKFHISQGMKSREKTVVVRDITGDGIGYASKILEMLRQASVGA